MRILLLHFEDSPQDGPWSKQRWDLLVALGKCSQSSANNWAAHYKCPVLRADAYRQDIADCRAVRQILSSGAGRLLDQEGLDWWSLLSPAIVERLFAILGLRGIAAEINSDAEIWTTSRRPSTFLLEALLERSIRSFRDSRLARGLAHGQHYIHLLQHFSPAQLAQITLDKYDSGYRWRSRFAASPKVSDTPFVLVPSAYANVSRMAAAYASLLPEQRFLMVATRYSAYQFSSPPNVEIRRLAAYARGDFRDAELESLMEKWATLRTELRHNPEVGLLERIGVLDSFPRQFRDGLRARNAWRNALTVEPVCGVFCGDDSNPYTRLPVLLAARRGIATVDFHHGALDGMYMFKDLPCDVYLAKNEMERDYLVRVCGLSAEKIVIGAPPVRTQTPDSGKNQNGGSAVFFSEPYEGAQLRTAEVYREIFPALCRLARENGRSVIVKLHPFESRSQRSAILSEVLSLEDRKLITVIDGPLTPELMAQTWFGMTVESTTVIDCLQHGVCCFLCGWLSLSPYAYARQYARFGAGEILDVPECIPDISRRLEAFHQRSKPKFDLSPTVVPSLLRQWLTSPRVATFVRSDS